MNRRELFGLAGTAMAHKLYDPRDNGAKADGVTLDSAAINATIDRCSDAGGGVVYLRPGVYLCGTVVLKSNVTLYLEAGATILGSKNIADYTTHPGPPEEGDANGRHLIFAKNAENIGLAGPGRVDGQGPSFWAPSGRKTPAAQDAWRDVATYDWKPLRRPSPMVEFVRCRYVRVDDVRLENAPGWTMRPIECDYVYIRGISIKNPVIGPNTDGIDPTGCQNVFISDCFIDTGDDCICLKSESPYGGEPRLSSNVVITNCVMTCCCNGLKFGTATRGGFENVTFSNSVIYNTTPDLKARVISGVALEMVDGGYLEGVTISNIRMRNVRTPIFIRRGNRRPRPDGTPGTLRGVMIENVHATGAVLSNSITGIPGFDVEDVTLRGIRIDTDELGLAAWTTRAIPEQEKSYPEARMFGRMPAWGFYVRHVTGLRLRDVEVRTSQPDERPALVCDDVRDLELSNFRANRGTADMPVVRLVKTRQAFVTGCVAPEGTGTFVEAVGAECARITLSNNEVSAAQKTFVQS